MGGIASRGQLRMSFLRWALVIVPLVVLLGYLSGMLAGSTGESRWYAALAKPSFQPPSALFGIVWPILYALMGLALAMVLHARGSRWRGVAIVLFAAQLIVNLTWSPLFFGMHQVTAALWWILLMVALAAATALLFWRIRPLAALLLAPYLAWLVFAAALTFQIDRLNPEAETLVPGANSYQI
ncbi:MAG: tryptophan-rich sensory protein [Sphingomonadaceae bacterium]|nr:tryptophan-rich sensory protein [Sphingomonadaceae bacterium]